jgi:hypothetical protein
MKREPLPEPLQLPLSKPLYGSLFIRPLDLDQAIFLALGTHTQWASEPLVLCEWSVDVGLVVGLLLVSSGVLTFDERMCVYNHLRMCLNVLNTSVPLPLRWL